MSSLAQRAPHEALAPEIDLLLDHAAARISQLGLEMPVMLFLELHLPLVSLFQTLGLLFEPAAAALFGAERIHKIRLMLPKGAISKS